MAVLKKHKRSHWPKGVSETVLMDLWRAVVKKEWDGICAFKGVDFKGRDCFGPIECHHIKKRGIRPLRYMPINGMPLCKYHHDEARYGYMQDLIRAKVNEKHGPEAWDWLNGLERKLLPDFLAARAMTRGEWLIAQKEYLMKLLLIAKAEELENGK